MFKIHNNDDGTMSVLDRNSGYLLCTIPTKGNSSTPRPVNVVVPQSKTSEEATKPSISDTEKDAPFTREEESDCERFFHHVDLVPWRTFLSVTRQELAAKWPLRDLSKSVAFLHSTDAATRDHPKIPDQLSLTSLYGLRLLSRVEPADERHVTSSLRAYESFCRHPYNTACPTACHFPKLRCRVEKQFPVVTPARVLQHRHLHTYARGRRQREERRRTLHAGLDARSRRLLRQCSSACVVRVPRMPDHEIQEWLSRRDPRCQRRDEYSDDSDIEEVYADPSYKPRTYKRVPNTLRQSRAKSRTQGGKPCQVGLRDVLKDVRARRDGCFYVLDTTTKVSNYKEVLGQKRPNAPNDVGVPKDAPPKNQVPRKVGRPLPAILRRAQLLPKKPKVEEAPPPAQVASSSRAKEIPLIDLTGDSPPPRPPVRRLVLPVPIQQWRFRCFACGHHRFFVAKDGRQGAVDREVAAHLRSFHNVADPTAFITRYLDAKHACVFIEAFPGFKDDAS